MASSRVTANPDSMRPAASPWRLVLVVSVLCLALLTTVLSQQQPPVISFHIIVVESRDAADRILEQLRGGENVVALASRVSVDPSAANGGLVGPLPLSELRPQIRSAVEGLRVG